MSSSFKTSPFFTAAVLSIPIMVFLSWGGLTLPFDFQPDPNYSHVLNGLHLADTGRFDNTFYPGLVNFYLMALFNLMAGVTLPSSPLFGVASLEKATYVARSAQLTITMFTMWGWMYALSTLLPFKKTSEQDRLAYAVALVATLSFMMFSYAFIFQTYFLRPDNALSLCIALGIALLATMRVGVLEHGRIASIHAIYAGIWMFFMTATKSQGQAFIGLGILFIFYLAVSRKPAMAASNRTVNILRAVLGATMLGAFAVARGFSSYSAVNQYALAILIVLLTLILLISFFSRAVPTVVALHIAAGWCACLILVFCLTGGATAHVLEIANPLNSLIVQMKYDNLKFQWAPLLFHLKQLGVYGLAPLLLSVVGAVVFRKKSMFMLLASGVLMMLITSLRQQGYYNGILFMPFFDVAAGLCIYYLLAEKLRENRILIVMLLVACHAASNINLHSSHISALHGACLSRGSMAGVRYDPDTINQRYTVRNEGWADYSKHYFTVITDFDYWPVTRDKLKQDKQFQQLLDGTLITCPAE